MQNVPKNNVKYIYDINLNRILKSIHTRNYNISLNQPMKVNSWFWLRETTRFEITITSCKLIIDLLVFLYPNQRGLVIMDTAVIHIQKYVMYLGKPQKKSSSTNGQAIKVLPPTTFFLPPIFGLK